LFFELINIIYIPTSLMALENFENWLAFTQLQFMCIYYNF
jgi:hypothetical protein